MSVVDKAAFIKALLGPLVGEKGLKVDSPEFHLTKNIAYQNIYRIGAIALVPVPAVTNDDAHFGFTFHFIDVKTGTVANVLTVQCFYSKLTPGC